MQLEHKVNRVHKNVEKSKRLRGAIRARAQQCYANAWDAIETQEEYKHATYVEGMAVARGLVIEHGWVEQDGEIIDPTLPDADVAYFAGLRFKGRDGLDFTWRIPGLIESGKKLPIFYRFGWGGVNSPEFLQAIVEAYRFAGMGEAAESYANYARSRLPTPKAG
jgi:hypothetical protein